MYLFWDLITEPILEAARPRCVVEIGSEDGNSTSKLLTVCQRHDAILHAIDPWPRFDVAAWKQHYGHHLVVHQALSLLALPTLPPFDIVFIDGDHNWYTVFNELKLIEQRSSELGQSFPLIFLHDIGWPYGRRDLYYDPKAIPQPYRQPFATGGLRPGSSELVEGGFNSHLSHAIAEGTPRNGVLTGVEDFLNETKQALKWIHLPGFYGLGLLFPTPLLEQKDELGRCLKMWDLPGPALSLMQMVESDRVARIAMYKELEAKYEQAKPQTFGHGFTMQVGY